MFTLTLTPTPNPNPNPNYNHNPKPNPNPHLLDRLSGKPSEDGQKEMGDHKNARSTMAHAVIRSHTFVELVDISPTLVELARIPAPPHLEGRSLKR